MLLGSSRLDCCHGDFSRNTVQGTWVFSVQRSRSEQRHRADLQGEAETSLASSRTLERLLLTCGLIVRALAGEPLNSSLRTDSQYGNGQIPPLNLLVPEDDGAIQIHPVPKSKICVGRWPPSSTRSLGLALRPSVPILHCAS